MRIFNCLLIAFFILCGNVYGQLNENVFAGVMTLSDGTMFTYKIKLNKPDSLFSGYSITDINGPNETKTSIKGVINIHKKEVYFVEKNILETKSLSDKKDFCFVRARLKITEVKGAKALKGRFKGFKPDGKTSCAEGTMVLFGTAGILEKITDAAQNIDTAEFIKQTGINPADIEAGLKNYLQDTATVAVTEQPANVKDNTSKIAPGETYTISCDTNVITLEVWDNEKIDGDIISILHNDQTILNHYELMANHKLVTVHLTEGGNTIKIVANNEGTEPPNTARMILHTGSHSYTVDASTTLYEPVQILLKRK